MLRQTRARSSAALWIVQLLPLCVLALLFAVPLVTVGVYAFARGTFGGVELAFTFSNFQHVLSGFYLKVFIRTLVFAAAGTLLCGFIAAPFAYALARKTGRLKLVLLMLLLVPFWTSLLIRALSWRTLLAPGGPIEWIANLTGLHHGDLDVLSTDGMVFMGIVYGYLPLAAVPLFVAFERIPSSMLQASSDLGAGPLRTFRYVTLPLARTGIVTAVVLTLIPMTGEYVIPALLGGDRMVLAGSVIYNQYLVAANYPLGAAMAVMLLIVLGLAVAVLFRLNVRSTLPGDWAVHDRSSDTRNPWIDRVLRAWIVLVFVFLFAPIVTTVIYAFNRGELGRQTARLTGFTVEWFTAATENLQLRDAFGTSLKVALAVAVLATLLGTMAGITLVRYPGWIARSTTVLVYLLLVVPEVVHAVALLLLFGQFDLDLSLATLVAGHVPFPMALVAVIVRSRVVALDKDLEAASADLGATPSRTMAHVVLPQLWPAILAGFLLAFTFSFDDVVVSLFLATPSATTLPVYLFGSIRVGVTPAVYALATLMLLVTVVGLGAAALVHAWRGAAAPPTIHEVLV